MLRAGQDYLMIGVLQSYVSTRDYFGAGHVFPIYIEVPDEIRRARARAREMKEVRSEEHTSELQSQR